MAAIAPEGLPHSSWADLLFSPRAAWLFDARARQFVWGSASARERFGADLSAFARSLPPATLKRLSAIARFKRRPLAVTETLVMSGGGESLPCRIEGLSLADGSTGLIIRDARGEPAPKTPEKPSHPPRRALATPPAIRKPPATLRSPAASPRAPALSPEDARSLRAIARRVRRICREKQAQADGRNVPAPSRAKPDKPAQPRAAAQTQSQRIDARILQAFDAYAELDAAGCVLSLSGRLCRLAGWTAGRRFGAPLAAFAEGEDKLRIEALIARALRDERRPASADLLLRDSSGAAIPCRIVIGAQSEQADETRLWAAIISLKTSRRLLCTLSAAPAESPGARRAA